MTITEQHPAAEAAPAPTPGGRWIVRVAVAFTVLFVAYGALTVVALLMHQHATTNRTFAAGQIRTVVIDSGDGSVRLTPATDAETHLQVRQRWNVGKPVFAADVTGDVLTVRTHCPSFVLLQCGTDLGLQIPPDVAVRVDDSDGHLDARGLRGPVSLATGDGSVHLEDVVSPDLKISTGDGMVTLSNVSAPRMSLHTGDGIVRATGLTVTQLTARSGDGYLHLHLVSEPAEVDLSTGDGRVELIVPRTQESYRVDPQTGKGEAHIDVRQDPASPRLIRLHSGDGSVTVRYP